VVEGLALRNHGNRLSSRARKRFGMAGDQVPNPVPIAQADRDKDERKKNASFLDLSLRWEEMDFASSRFDVPRGTR